MGASQRRKGHDWEREVARRFRELYPEACRGYQTRGGTAEEPDCKGTPFFIECKVGAMPNLKNALVQANEGMKQRMLKGDSAKPPIAVCKWDRGPAIVGMYLEDFLALIRLSRHQGL